MYTLQLGTIYTNHNSFSPGGPIPHNMACSLMPRQPYNIAVSITTGQLFPPYTSPMPHLIYARLFEDLSFSTHRLGGPGLFLNQD